MYIQSAAGLLWAEISKDRTFMYCEIHFPLQALSLSDNALTGLGVTRESVDSTAGAAQVCHRL